LKKLSHFAVERGFEKTKPISRLKRVAERKPIPRWRVVKKQSSIAVTGE
jgi:hypothetical protein